MIVEELLDDASENCAHGLALFIIAQVHNCNARYRSSLLYLFLLFQQTVCDD